MASSFIGFLVEKYDPCQSQNSISDAIVFDFFMRKRVEKSEAILALLDTFKELHLEW